MKEWLAGIRETAGLNFGRLKDSRAVWVMAGLLVLVHGMTVVAGWNAAEVGPWEKWGLSRGGIFSGRIWQVATHAMIHGSWMHLALNVLFLLTVGSRMEHIVGGRVVCGAVASGVLLGGLFHLALGQGVLVGFSGAAFALWMLLIGLSPDSRILPFPGPCVWLGWGVLGLSMVLAVCDPLAGFGILRDLGDQMSLRFGAWVFEVGHACHVGGGVAGWLVGLWILRPRVSLVELQKQRARREARRARGE